MMPRVASAGTRTSRPGERPIGVFDSGVGGLTVLHELLVQLPHEDYVYLGDTARFPYGERSPGELERFSVEIAVELLRRGTKLIVVACNSATAAALPALSRRMMETTLGVEVLGVVRPEAFQAVAATRNGRIGLLATPTTVASGAYAEAVGTIDPYVTLHSVACAALAGIIQAGEQFDARATETVRSACAPLSEARVDTVILGCTHYPLIRPLLQRLLGPEVVLVSSGAALARQVEHVLSTRERPHGRAVEIHRLVGRSLRVVVDFAALGECTVYLDCDVLQADGGTRCASITGAYVALSLACAAIVADGRLERSPLTGSVAAVSCGVVGGTALLDLDYGEDSRAEVVANGVMSGEGGLIEVQATAERTPLSRAHLDELLVVGAGGSE